MLKRLRCGFIKNNPKLRDPEFWGHSDGKNRGVSPKRWVSFPYEREGEWRGNDWWYGPAGRTTILQIFGLWFCWEWERKGFKKSSISRKSLDPNWSRETHGTAWMEIGPPIEEKK